ncbi:hypothetical protein [Lapidilactobacillus bayanensis]|uniref:hypothetical protein n=1 Tax=Lapidilactobacillus bayanensis TaxID=2485998 RepID=UPI000F773BD1|nr:hypothetical protein [Lapidilactobacillus bayanensis]
MLKAKNWNIVAAICLLTAQFGASFVSLNLLLSNFTLSLLSTGNTSKTNLMTVLPELFLDGIALIILITSFNYAAKAQRSHLGHMIGFFGIGFSFIRIIYLLGFAPQITTNLHDNASIINAGISSSIGLISFTLIILSAIFLFMNQEKVDQN